MPPTRLTADMRPAGDTSRKYIRIDDLGRAYATGRRKTAVARVWVWEVGDEATASVSVNGMNLSQFLGGHWALRHSVLAPFLETETAGKYSVMATVKGGGLNGARRHVNHTLSAPAAC